jgi:uncharacterized protein
VDFIFLAARPSEALLIRPQLRFHYAGTLPIYATSSIYDPARSDNAELDGVLFADMPWRVGAGDAEFMARFAASAPTPWTATGGCTPSARTPTGWCRCCTTAARSSTRASREPPAILRVGTDSRVHRELEWGRFQGGQVKHAPARVLAEEQAAPPES